MGVAETVNVESIDDDGEGERQLEAKCVPLERDAAGLWVWTMQVVARGVFAEDLERIVVHELVHVIVGPLRDTYLGAKATWLLTTANPKDIFAQKAVAGDVVGKMVVMPPGSDLKEIISAGSLTTWETVIDRFADAFLRAYAVVERAPA